MVIGIGGPQRLAAALPRKAIRQLIYGAGLASLSNPDEVYLHSFPQCLARVTDDCNPITSLYNMLNRY